ncbi:ARMADILLO BTB ARABIDOPSIS PROTEIN 1-like [Aristolochia californica]|uniref:ARMADILLO BTB ARABIDOPSIS PROTEIN 1-like n=1 Tax=Aristolochia californica TaxID=171875 RepID=UPI0035D92A8E
MRERKEEDEAGNDGARGFRRSIELLSSLISLSHTTKVFQVKWQLIRTKLEQLYSGLTASQDSDFSENSSIRGLISAVISTTEECQDLARRCVDLTYSGKLLMQSDLDVIAAKFEAHVKSLSSFYTNGILTHGYALVVSRPGPAASRDDMKFYIRDLFTRLKIGDSGMTSEALKELNEFLHDDDKYVRIVAETPDILALLPNFLESSNTVVQGKSAETVSLIAGFDSFKGLLVGNGVVSSLIRVLENGNEFGKENAARGLQKLTENSDNAWSVSAHGGVTVLLRICDSGSSNSKLIGPSCGVLRNLAGVDEIKKFMVEEGAVSTFIRLLTWRDEAIQIRAIEFLQTLVSGDEAVRQMVVRDGGIQSLLRVLDPNCSYSSKTREITLRAIESFSMSSTNSVNVLLGLGFLDRVLFFLRNGEVSTQELAIKMAFRLCRVSEETKKAMGEAGFMSELVKLLDAKSFQIRDMAAEALTSLISIPRNRKKFVQEDSNIVRVLQLLDPDEEKPSNRQLLLSMISSLTNSSSGRKKIAASGYVKTLEKLAETEVPEAKRIVRKLSQNRFRSLFNIIWH